MSKKASFYSLAEEVADKLYQRRSLCGKKMLLDPDLASDFLQGLLRLVYPQFLGDSASRELIVEELAQSKGQLDELLESMQLEPQRSERAALAFFSELPEIALKLEKDAEALFEADPAAQSLEEVVFSYPGLYAIAVYRLAHSLLRQDLVVLPRMLAEFAHRRTGIEIHPGARIGESFVIDHGTGVVIGETAVVGNHVKLYQGVTLGALSVEKNLARQKRHPTIEDNCVVYANATILGGNTIIGRDSVIGGNVWITKSVPPRSLVYHKSEVKFDSKSTSEVQELTYEI